MLMTLAPQLTESNNFVELESTADYSTAWTHCQNNSVTSMVGQRLTCYQRALECYLALASLCKFWHIAESTSTLNPLSAGMGCEFGARMQCRYLWLHNYNLTVTEVFAAINRPDLRTQMMASLQLNANTAAGDFDAFVEFLQYGELLSFAGCLFTKHLMLLCFACCMFTGQLMPLQVTS